MEAVKAETDNMGLLPALKGYKNDHTLMRFFTQAFLERFPRESCNSALFVRASPLTLLNCFGYAQKYRPVEVVLEFVSTSDPCNTTLVCTGWKPGA
eukprot:307429-Pelagomonas_calceolata.AAC.2